MTRKIILIIGSVFIIIGIGYFAMLKSSGEQPFHENPSVSNRQCPIKIEETMRGRCNEGAMRGQ